MKKLKLTGKLSLNKETIAELTKTQLRNLKGGYCIASTLSNRSCLPTNTCGSLNTNTPGYIDCCA